MLSQAPEILPVPSSPSGVSAVAVSGLKPAEAVIGIGSTVVLQIEHDPPMTLAAKEEGHLLDSVLSQLSPLGKAVLANRRASKRMLPSHSMV